MEFVTTSTSKAADLDPVCPVGRSVHLVTRCWKHRYPTVVRAPRDVPCARGTEAVGRALDAVRAARRGRNRRVLDVSRGFGPGRHLRGPGEPRRLDRMPAATARDDAAGHRAAPAARNFSSRNYARGRRRRRRRRYARARTRLPWSSRPRGTRPRATRHPPRPRHPRLRPRPSRRRPRPTPQSRRRRRPLIRFRKRRLRPRRHRSASRCNSRAGRAPPTTSSRAPRCCRHSRSSRWVDCSSRRGYWFYVTVLGRR